MTSRSNRYLTLNVSETVRDTDIVEVLIGTHMLYSRVSFRMTLSDFNLELFVFMRPGLRHFINPPPVNDFEQVYVVKFLSNNFCFDAQVGNVLKMSS